MQNIFAAQFENLDATAADVRVRELLAAIAVSDRLTSEQKRIQRTALKQWYRDTFGDRDFFVCSPKHRERIRAKHARAEARRAA